MLWRQVIGFRRHVCELKSATERLRLVICKLDVMSIFKDCAFTFYL